MLALFVAVCFAFPAALSVIVHTINWQKILGRPLRRLETYTLGALFITGLPTLLLLAALRHMPMGALDSAALYLAACAGAGLAVYAAWGVDALVERLHALKDDLDRSELEPMTHDRPAAHRRPARP